MIGRSQVSEARCLSQPVDLEDVKKRMSLGAGRIFDSECWWLDCFRGARKS